MLSLDQPTLSLGPDNVCFYPDSDDRLTWYYLPLTPRVSVDAKGAPLVRLTKYHSDKHAFAILDLDVNLGLPAATLAQCAKTLKSTLSLPAEPRLVPMPAVQGSIELMLLDRRSSDKTGASELVKGISHAASPSLYNDNRAVFSVMLTPAGAEIVEASLGTDGVPDMSAVAVVYTLAFDALRPAYAIRARANWDEIEAYLKQRFTYESTFAGSDISKVVDEMTESRVIAIDVDNMLTPDAKESAIEGMLAQVRTMIFETFFKPAVVPRKEEKEPGFLDNVAGFLKKPGFFGLFGQFTWSKEDRTEIRNRSLDINLRERSVLRMKIHPQAYLHDIAQKAGSPPVVRNIYGDSDFFKKRALTVDVNLPFEAPDSIASVVVDLVYGKQRQSLIFRPNDKAPKQVSWASRLDGDTTMLREVAATYTVNFAARKDMTWPSTLTSKPQTVTGDFWTVPPRELYQILAVTFAMPPDFRWDQYPMATLHARYTDSSNGIALEQMWTLVKSATTSAPSVTWTIPTRDPQKTDIEYRMVCQSVSGRVIDPGLWLPGKAGLININPTQKDVTVYPPLSWPIDCDVITVQLSYDDPDNNLHVRPPLMRFEAETKEPQTVRLMLADPNRQTVGYQVGYYGEETHNAPPSLTDDPLIMLPAKPKGQTFVLCRPHPALFTGTRINKVELKLTHAESGAEKTMIFTSAKDLGRFAYSYQSDHTVTGKAIFSVPGSPKRTVKLVCAPPGTETVVTASGN